MSQEGKSKSLSTKEMWGCLGSVLAGFITGAFLLINTLIGTWGPRLPFFQAQASPTPVLEIASPSLESTLTPELASPTSPAAEPTTTPTSIPLPSPTLVPTVAASAIPAPSPVREGLGEELDGLSAAGK